MHYLLLAQTKKYIALIGEYLQPDQYIFMDLISGYPLSLIEYGLPYEYPKLTEDISTDVLVLGGGISGALVSYYLTQAGIENVVTDARTIGLGSSCASTSLLQYEIDVPLCKLQHLAGPENAAQAYRLCSRAIDTIENISEKIKYKDFQRLPSLYYAAYKKDELFLKEEFAIRKKEGFDVTLLNSSEVKQAFGFDAPGAILSAQGARTNAYSLAHALHQYSIKKGAQVFDRSEVMEIKYTKTGVIAKTKTNTVSAKRIVYATGYESVKYIDKKIVNLNSTFVVCSEQGNGMHMPFNNKAMLWNTADPYLYMRTTSDNRIIVGGRDEKFYNPLKRDIVLKAKTKLLIKDFQKLYPGSLFSPEFSWAGTFGTTKDGLPYIGRYSKLPHSYFALGFGGNGITFSLIAAEILTDLLQGKANKDAHIFSFDRP